MIVVEGIDNYGKPRQNFADRLHAMSEEDYLKETETTIWLSAFANNNPRSDYHWQVDVCIEEAKLRGDPKLYDRAYEAARATF